MKGKLENILLPFTFFFLFFFFFFVLKLSNITKIKAYLVIYWILIWFFLHPSLQKSVIWQLRRLKHVQKAYNCIIVQRECAPPLSTLNHFQLRPLPWSEIARFEIGDAIYIVIIVTSFFFFFFFFIYSYSIRLWLHKHMLLQLNLWWYL